MSAITTTAAGAPDARNLPSWWRWAIVLTASLGAVLEIIDTSIVNVALPHMQSNFGATLSEIGWVVTGYAVANVIIIPLSAWLGDHFGKKTYFVFSLIGFVAASLFCGMATSLPMLIVARVLQGLTGGGLLAKAQAIIFETFPKEEQGMAQAVFGLGVIVGPAIGPTLGGYLTDTVGWRWMFFINLPIGLLAIMAASIFLPPDKPNPHQNRKVDWWGITFLTLGLAAFQTFLEEGHQDEWFASPFITTMAILSVIGLTLFIWQELTVDYPAVNLRVLRHRSLAAGSMFSMILGMGLYGTLFAVPIFVQNILNFTAMKTGLLLMPGALASGAMMIVVGQLARRIDPRLLIGLGTVGMTLVMLSLAHINPNMGEDSLFWPLIWRGVVTVMIYLPLNLATFSSIPRNDISAASGFFNLTRQIGGSIGIAVLTTFLAERQNFHRTVLVDHVNPYNPVMQQRLQEIAGGLMQSGVDATTAHTKAYGIINGMIDMQAQVLSFGDTFWFVGCVMLLSLLLLFFLGKGSSDSDMPADVH